MTNEILDTPFENEFPVFLEKGETILWKGQSQKSDSIAKKKTQYSNKVSSNFFSSEVFLIVFSFSILTAIIFFWFKGLETLSIILLVLLLWMCFPVFLDFFSSEKYRQFEYLITQKRLFIYLLGNKKSPIHIIELSSISNISISKFDNLGTITFQVQNQPTTDIVFRKFKDGKNETFASLENIKQPDDVLQLLKKSIFTESSD